MQSQIWKKVCNMKKKCVILNRYSVNNKEMIDEKKKELIAYCTEELKIEDYEYFEEIGSCLADRPVFDEIMKRLHNGEFTDLLVYHIDRIFKETYDKKKFHEIINEIRCCNIEIHTMMER